MNSLVRQFFSVQEGGFHEVLFLEEHPEAQWEEVSAKTLGLPRGWFELSRLSSADRIEFTRDFWMGRMPFHPHLHEVLTRFFERLEDVSIVLCRKQKQELFCAECVYSLQENCSFFRGWPPAASGEVFRLEEGVGRLLPRDYLSFLQIHNGFGKLSNMGLFQIESVMAAKAHLLSSSLESALYPTLRGKSVDPSLLIPFYESLELSSFQCFYADWYPGSEMGNIYLSMIDYTISDMSRPEHWEETRAYPTFSEWLSAFLEGMNVE